MRLIFQMSVAGDFSEEAKLAFLADTSTYAGNVREGSPIGCIFDDAAGEEPDLPYFNWAFLCVQKHLAEIDAAIDSASEGWSVSRMSAVDLAILRVAAAELLYIEDIDTGVSVDEAVILAKKYGSEKSAKFINGVLGTVARGEREARS